MSLTVQRHKSVMSSASSIKTTEREGISSAPALGNEAPRVSVLVLTMNRSQELMKCLQSLEPLDRRLYEVVVVDNGSTDDTPDLVQGEFPWVRFHRLHANVGATGGRHVAFTLARGEYCVVLDDDAEFRDVGQLEKAVRRMEEDERLGVIAFNIVNAYSGEVDVKAIPRRDKRLLEGWSPCTYFCAAGALIRRRAYEAAGGLWEALFIYAEELDLSYRILDAGYHMLFTTEIEVLHRETPCARPSGRYLRFATRNRIWIGWRNLPWPGALSMSLAWMAKNGWVALRCGEVGAYLSGVREAIVRWRKPWLVRKVIGPHARRQLRLHSGRSWY